MCKKGTLRIKILNFRFDKDNDGSISATDSCQTMSTVKGHLLTDFTKNNLVAVAADHSSSHKVFS